MSQAILFIGPPKTGSTYVQGVLRTARAELRSHGIHYLTGFKAGVRAFKPRFRKDPGARLELDDLKSALIQIPVGEHAVISEEAFAFCALDARAQAQLHEVLSSRFDRVRYVSIARPVVSWAASRAQQQIKALHFDRRARQHISFDRELSGDYDFRLLSFDEVIKGDTPGYLAQLLDDTFGIGRLALSDITPKNTSLGAEGVFFQLALGSLLQGALGGPPPPRREWQSFKKGQSLLVDAIRTNLDTTRPYQPFPKKKQERIARDSRESSQRTIELFMGDWAEQIFTSDGLKRQVVVLEQLPPGRLDYIRDLVDEIWQALIPIYSEDLSLDPKFRPRASFDQFLEQYSSPKG